MPIIEILVKPGDAVKAEQSLVTLESDKATMDVPSPAAGIVREILAKIGDKVSMGKPLLMLEEEGAKAPAAPPAAAPAAPPAAAPAPAPVTASPAPVPEPPPPASAPSPTSLSPALPDFSGVNAGPAVRRLARELGLDLTTITGTGEKGRITREDVKAALGGGGGGAKGGAGLPEVPTVDFAKFGPIETVPLSRIKRISGPRLHASWVNIPHVTHTDEADITDLEAFRKSLDDAAKADKKAPYRVSLLPLLMKAAVATLKAFPTFNSALNPAKDALIYRNYWHIGVAVDTPDGLVVAVVKDVDKKGVIELARELGALSGKAREGKLSPAEMQGATVHDLLARRHRRHGVHADRQRARGRDPRRRAIEDGAGLGRRGVPAAADAAALPLLRSPRHRRRGGGAFHAPSRWRDRGHAARAALSSRSRPQTPATRSGLSWQARSGFPISATSRTCRSSKST